MSKQPDETDENLARMRELNAEYIDVDIQETDPEANDVCSMCGSRDGAYFHCLLVVQKECRKRDAMSWGTVKFVICVFLLAPGLTQLFHHFWP